MYLKKNHIFLIQELFPQSSLYTDISRVTDMVERFAWIRFCSFTKNNFIILLFFICIIHPCGSSKYKHKQTKHTKHRKLQFDDITGYTE